MSVNLRLVSRHLALLMFVLSGLILVVGVFSLIEHWAGTSLAEGEIPGLMLSAVAGCAIGGLLLWLGKRSSQTLGQREALVLVAMSWIIGAAVAALPFYIWSQLRPDHLESAHSFDNFVSCYFESMSGLTTTGATVVTKLATLPRGLLLWRAITHWLGGLGIVVLFVAVLPLLGVGGRRVYKIEAPGPTPEGVTPRIRDTARILWLIYCGLTVAEIIALRVCGMTWFESVCHTFATLATGGFSTSDASIAGFDSTAIHVVIIVFMLFAGINFGLYHQLLQGRWRDVVRDPELRTYLGIIAVASIIVIVSLSLRPPNTGPYDSFGRQVQDGVFQVVAVQTTTGFCSADFDAWGFTAKITLLALMFVGGSAGSTGGGIKVMRIMIAAKILVAELEHVYRRRVVRTVKIGRSTIDPELKIATLGFILAILVLVMVGAVALQHLEPDIDFTTAATASVATLNNIGPGLGKVGATQNYAWFSASSKAVMCVLMLLGRLEMFTVLVLFSPRFWARD